MKISRTLRLSIAILWLLTLLGLAAVLYSQQLVTPLGATFSPLFTLLGRAPKTMDRVVSRTLGASDEDELPIGLRFHQHLQGLQVQPHDCAKPIADLLNTLTPALQRKLPINGFIIRGAPNAMAFPGGNIAVTTGLLDALPTDAQRAAVLAHELGHTELRHVFDAVKFEMASQRIGMDNLGETFDRLNQAFLRHSFSKTQEEEADAFAFQMLIARGYPPTAMAEAFESLQKATHETNPAASVLRDYFSSHPPLQQRIDNYRSKAKAWMDDHPGSQLSLSPPISEGCEKI